MFTQAENNEDFDSDETYCSHAENAATESDDHDDDKNDNDDACILNPLGHERVILFPDTESEAEGQEPQSDTERDTDDESKCVRCTRLRMLCKPTRLPGTRICIICMSTCKRILVRNTL